MTKTRCPWAEHSESMSAYHDHFWGVPEYNDQQLFRKLMLDINQAGLSWQTILNKLPAFDEAYDQFDLSLVAAYEEEKIEELMQNAGIIRNRRKIEAAVTNAQCVQKIQQESGSFAKYLWGFVDGRVVDHKYATQQEVPTTSELSDRLTKDMRARGFKFVGSTTLYAFLEAVGLINDHLTTCFRYEEVKKEEKDA